MGPAEQDRRLRARLNKRKTSWGPPSATVALGTEKPEAVAFERKEPPAKKLKPTPAEIQNVRRTNQDEDDEMRREEAYVNPNIREVIPGGQVG